MRVLHLFASPYWSGPAENIALLAAAQRELGHDVTVAIDRRRFEAGAEELALPRFAERNLLDDHGLELSVKSGPRQIWRDLKELRRRTIDVLHTHFSHDHYLARWSRTDKRIIVRSIHSPRSIRWSLPDADGFTITTESDRGHLGNRPTMILSALVGSEFTPSNDKELLRRELEFSGRPLIGMASTFKKSRRHPLGLQAFLALRGSVPAARMLMMGDGQELPAVKRETERLGLTDAVRFTGYLAGSDFIKRLQSLDVLWVLGLGNDWSARVAAQASACAVPVVGVDEGALPGLADAVVSELTPQAVAAASLSVQPRQRLRRTNFQIASEVAEFYIRVQQQVGRDHPRRDALHGLI